MTKNADGSDRLLNRATHFSAVLLLLCIPFRATVDNRGGRLALVVLLLACMLARRHEWGACVPDSRALRVAGLVWLLSTFMWALFGPTPDESLQILRRDVLSPILGFCVFHALTKTRTDLMRWVLLAFAVQTLVAILAVLDPFQPNVTTHRPAYIVVGVLSAWLVIIAALLPLLWWAPRRLRARYRPLAVVMAISLGAAAFASGNRLIWFCFAVMLLAGTNVAIPRRPRGNCTACNERQTADTAVAGISGGPAATGLVVAPIARPGRGCRAGQFDFLGAR